jgi:predicted ArsR family transcriptional regulator
MLGASRARVLSTLQDAAEPLAVTDVALSVGLHPNTARFHLDALVDNGMAQRAAEERELPGRPRTLYTAVAGSARAGRRSYRLLAEVLTTYLAAHNPRPAAAGREAGKAWGRFFAERPKPSQHIDAAAATAQLVRTLDEIGFEPEVVTVAQERQVLLHHCPFREAASEHSEVVCSVHLGLMQGLLAELDAPFQAARLDPFVEPSLCVTHLADRKAPKARRRAG